jgi:copper resistance protein B
MKRLSMILLLGSVSGLAYAQQAKPVDDRQDMSMDDMPGMSMPHQHHDAPPAAASSSALPPNDHIPPPPPQRAMHAMAQHAMDDAMDMHDTGTRGMLLIDRLERTRSTGGDYATAWEGEGWWGSDIDRLWIRSEGERQRGTTQDARIDLLWGHAWTTYWDGQLGIRQDFGSGPRRQWLAVGVQGLAPYWFETQATFYAGEQGRTALRLESSYDVLFTQRLILTPKVELNLYSRNDPQRAIRAGLSEAEAGLRLRYEFSRRFAPYIGVSWAYRRVANAPSNVLFDTAAHETTWIAGIRFWF